MADAKTTPLTITKASPEEAAPGDSPDIPDIEMVDSTREWPVENDAWQYLHEDVQDSAAAKEQAAHEVLMPPLTPCHKMDDEQQKSMEDLNTAIASMQVTFDALAVGAPAAEKFAPTSLGSPEGAGALGPGTPEGGDVVSSLAPGSAESHAMDSTPPPRKRPLEVPALPGFTRASTSTSSTASSPMVTTTKTAEGYRIDALPESFPRLSSVGATLVAKMTVPELCQLFAKFLDTPPTGPGVERSSRSTCRHEIRLPFMRCGPTST